MGYIGMFVYPWDILDEGIDQALGNLADEVGIDAIHLATTYHSVKMLLPHDPRRAEAAFLHTTPSRASIHPASGLARGLPFSHLPSDFLLGLFRLLLFRLLLLLLLHLHPNPTHASAIGTPHRRPLPNARPGRGQALLATPTSACGATFPPLAVLAYL